MGKEEYRSFDIAPPGESIRADKVKFLRSHLVQSLQGKGLTVQDDKVYLQGHEVGEIAVDLNGSKIRTYSNDLAAILIEFAREYEAPSQLETAAANN